ncbi:MAG: U32 family peptidase [Oscillospiraceae bacterium]|jgi:putative protease|nr:U32 family peptidase [Oscillospiraceae bacterium]
MELLSPAGNMQKLKTAFLYGADAVYLAGKTFGMRAAADNFSLAEIEEACGFARSSGKKVYLTVNVFAKEFEIAGLNEYLREIRALGALPDALICSDLGVVMLAREILPDVKIHISTQANTQNHLTCKAWEKLGASRIILARELSIKTIKEIRENISPALELEAFVHGAMCVAYSGRCLLSNYLTGRDANSGNCTQPCRWEYHVTENKHQNSPISVEEDERGTTLFSSRDLCMIDNICDLAGSGLNSLKIEGRMKPAFYVAAVTNAYRLALDAYFADPAGYVPDASLRTEVESVSHREYDTGYFFAPPSEKANICENPGYIKGKTYFGICVDYEENSGFSVFEQKNKIVKNTVVEILSPGKVSEAFTADILLDSNNEPIEAAPHPAMLFKVKCRAKPGDMLRSA